MAWVVLLVSGMLETVWALSLKSSQGLTRLWPSVLFVVSALASLGGLAYALRSLPVGTAYAVWSGIGALGTAIFAVILFAEPVNAMRVLGILLIVGGIAALKLA